MAVSGTTTFSVTRDNIIQYALRKCGVLEVGVTPDATTVTNVAMSFDMLVKNLIVKGIKLWTNTELTIPFTASKTTYTIGLAGSTPATVDVTTDKPMRLIQAWLRDTSVTPYRDIPLMVMSRYDYNILGSKFNTGTPNSVEMIVGREQATLNVYLTPDTNTATTKELHIVTQRQLYDVGLSTATLDFPQEWYLALGWALAAEIATDYGVPQSTLMFIEGKAKEHLAGVEDFDTEQQSVMFTPDLRYLNTSFK